ncbi:MAG: CHAT domain-containing tetratricopeptide repeat protein [Bacteroidota bacterium]
MNQSTSITMALLCLVAISHAVAQNPFKEQNVLADEIFKSNRSLKKAIQLERDGRPEKAVSAYQKASRKYSRNKQWTAYKITSYQWGQNCLHRGEHVAGIELVQEALGRLEEQSPELLTDSPSLYQLLLELHQADGNWAEATTVSQQQLEKLREKYPYEAHWDLVSAYFHQAKILDQQKAQEEAINAAWEAKVLAEQLEGSEYELTTQIYKFLLRHYQQNGAYAKAMEVLKPALAYTQAHPQHKASDVYFYYLRMGNYLTTLNEHQLAQGYFEKVLFQLQKEEAGQTNGLGLSKQEMGQMHFHLGVNHLHLGRPELATQHFETSFSITTQQKGKAAIQQAITSLISIGNTYAQQKMYAKAAHHFERAERKLQEVTNNGKNSEDYFHEWRKLLWNRAFAYYIKGNLTQSKKDFLTLIEQYSITEEQWQDTGSLFYLAIIAERQSNWPEALSYNHKALQALCHTFDSPDYYQLPALEDIREMGNTYWILNQKARYLALSAKKLTNADQRDKHFRLALQTVDLFDRLHERSLKRMNVLRGGQNTSLFKTSLMNYKEGLSIAYQHSMDRGDREAVEKGFYYSQRMKSQQLWMSLLTSEAIDSGEVPEALLAQKEQLLNDILAYEQKLLEAQRMGDEQQMALYKNEYLFEKRQEYQELIREMEHLYPAYYESKFAFVPETGASLRKILKEDELLIEYVFSDESLFVFTLSKGQELQMHQMPLDDHLPARIDSMHNLLQASSWLRKSNRKKFIELSHHLYQQLLAPIAHQLDGCQRLIIIGDGIMNYIPFDVLLPSAEVANFDELNYLIRQYELSYHYSASLFARARQKDNTAQSGLFAFAPVYEQSKHFLADQPTDAQYLSMRAFGDDGYYTPLPESEREVKTIAAMMAQHAEGDANQYLAVRSLANEATLKARLAMPYRYIHIAGHSFADLEHPKFSGIACHGRQANSSSMEDGILYAGEIYNIQTQADLVILSSCESGFGKLESAEGLMGLNRAFIYSGTPNVIFSLWKVYDKISAKVMVDFYEEVLSGQNYSASLRRAKLKLLSQPETAAPHYWSSYLLIGC